jgi:hypothetical protein
MAKRKPKVFRADTIRAARLLHPLDTPSQLAKRLGVDRRAVHAALKRSPVRGRPQGHNVEICVRIDRQVEEALAREAERTRGPYEVGWQRDRIVERVLRNYLEVPPLVR